MFNRIKNADYTTTGDFVDYAIEGNFLIFQESAQKRDWINNFAFPRKLYKKHWVHRGIANAWKSCNDEIMDKVKDIDNLIILGWSHGGGLAILAGEDYFYRTGKKATVHTYGSLKILATKKTRDYFKSAMDCYNNANYNDIVTYVVPWFCQVNTIRQGEKFNLFKLFKPDIYHTSY